MRSHHKPAEFVATLEALRGIAAWMVVLHHLRHALGEIWEPLGAVTVFAAGVDLFFILSGVVMVIMSERRPSPIQFLAGRAARILPLYWLVTALIVIMLAVGLRPLGIGEWSVDDISSSVMLWPAMRSDGYMGPLLAVAWTLIYEAAFYMIFAIALAARKIAPAPRIAAVSIGGLLLVGAFISPESLPLRTWTAPIMVEFLLGLLIGTWWCKIGRSLSVSRFVPILCAVIAVAALIGSTYLLGVQAEGALIPPLGSASTIRVLAFGVPMAVLVIAALLAQAAGIRPGKALQTAGAASYSTYLLHMLVIQAVEKVTGQGWSLLWALPMIALISISAHHWVEKPMIRTAKSLLGRTHTARPVSQRSLP